MARFCPVYLPPANMQTNAMPVLAGNNPYQASQIVYNFFILLTPLFKWGLI
jgi:hypothetical protein